MMFMEKVKEQSKELERVRKRNKQLKKNHEQLQKECDKIAKKIIATQVERAQSLETSIILRKELNEEKSSYFEKMSAIAVAEEANESLCHVLQEKSSVSQSSFDEMKYLREKLGFRKEMEKCLQDELLEYRLKAAENEATIHELRNVINELERDIGTMKRITPDTIVRIQEELIFAKTRELATEMEFENIKRDVSEIRLQWERRRKEKNKIKVGLRKSNSFLRRKRWDNAPDHLKAQYELSSNNLQEFTEEKKKLLSEISRLEKELEITDKQIDTRSDELRRLSDNVRKEKLREYKTTKDLLDKRKQAAELEKDMHDKLKCINQNISDKNQLIPMLTEKLKRLQRNKQKSSDTSDTKENISTVKPTDISSSCSQKPNCSTTSEKLLELPQPPPT